ncbi:hypothetical protein C8046_11940 [Serinibacter arcticus]|uniref:Uncharacterized protein n=1 Tax=Serinibacter arcticus TaxID=1655435 RepID=A0A2U1ZWE4_9MICO|nr:hypothetical protein C8046_11940 [Serinibacter arcticus]
MGALVLAVATWLVISYLNDDARQVRGTVASYLAALEEGDAETAVALIAGRGQGECPDLLTSAVYSTVAARPTDAEITDVRVNADDDGPAASASVSYARGEDGERATAQLTLSRDSDGWRLDGDSDLVPSPTQIVANGPGEVWVSGGCGVVDGRVLLAEALPGTYDVIYRDPFRVAEAAPVEVTIPTTGRTELDPAPAAEIVDTVTAQVTGWVEECLASGYAGPVCGEESVPADWLDVTSTREGWDPDLGMSVHEDGWHFQALPILEVEGTLSCEGDASPSCVPGEPADARAYLVLRGTVAVDDRGAVTVTRTS